MFVFDPVLPISHLFTARLWVEEFGYGQYEVRIQVKHVLSGEIRYRKRYLHKKQRGRFSGSAVFWNHSGVALHT